MQLAWVTVGRISQERDLFGVSIPGAGLFWSQSGVTSLTQHISTGFLNTLKLMLSQEMWYIGRCMRISCE